VAIGLDASRFDQHVSPDALRWEHSIYLEMFSGDDRVEIAKLLKWQLKNSGVAYTPEGVIKYWVDGARMSGDINTALGNCLLMCAMVWAYCKSVGVSKFELVNNGDDCTLIVESYDLVAVEANLDTWFTEMGFTMKMEDPVYEIEQIEFCQMHPVWVPTGYTMVRNVQVAMAKDAVSLVHWNTQVEYQSWLSAVGMGGAALCAGIPVMQEYYSAYVRSGNNKPNTKHAYFQNSGTFMFLGQGLTPRYLPVHPRTRASFYYAFGITPDEQVSHEGRLKAVCLPWAPPTPFDTSAYHFEVISAC
jgi:hypothetical protein